MIASKLAKQPELVSRQLKSSKHGVELILRLWGFLGESLDAKQGAWSDAEISTAFDLLGIPGHLRDGRAPFDPPAPAEDIYQYRRDFILCGVDRLQKTLTELTRVDRREREHAETGASVLGTKQAALIMRYERQAWQCYDAMLKVAKESASPELAMPEVVLESEVESNLEDEFETEPMMERQEYALPNEPNEKPTGNRDLNRHQRRRLAAKTRKG